jgi:hypothetical protein
MSDGLNAAIKASQLLATHQPSGSLATTDWDAHVGAVVREC